MFRFKYMGPFVLPSMIDMIAESWKSKSALRIYLGNFNVFWCQRIEINTVAPKINVIPTLKKSDIGTLLIIIFSVNIKTKRGAAIFIVGFFILNKTNRKIGAIKK